MIQRIKKDDESKLKLVDLNKINIDKKVIIPVTVFNSEKMYRLIAKIAYELHCKKYNIIEKNEKYKKLIEFITEGTYSEEFPVKIVTYEPLYNLLNQKSLVGSHTIVQYKDSNGELFTIIYLFGLIIYKVSLGSDVLDDNIFYYDEFTVDGERKEINLLNSLNTDIADCILESILEGFQNVEGIDFYVLSDQKKIDTINEIDFSIDIKTCLEKMNGNNCGNEYSKSIFEKNIRRMFDQIEFSIPKIKRFIKDCKLNLKDKNKLLYCSDEEYVFNLFLVYLIGKNNTKNIDVSRIENVVKKDLDKFIKINEELTSQIVERMKKQMQTDEKLLEKVKNGVDLVLKD